MKLEVIYYRCGLKDPKQYRKEVITQALFSENKHFQKSIIEDKRQLGKTTNFIMQGIQNLFHGKSTLILTHGSSKARLYSIFFEKRYSHLFPELLIRRETQESFVATLHSTSSARLEFAGIYDGVIHSKYLSLTEWDEVFDDAI